VPTLEVAATPTSTTTNSSASIQSFIDSCLAPCIVDPVYTGGGGQGVAYSRGLVGPTKTRCQKDEATIADVISPPNGFLSPYSHSVQENRVLGGGKRGCNISIFDEFDEDLELVRRQAERVHTQVFLVYFTHLAKQGHTRNMQARSDCLPCEQLLQTQKSCVKNNTTHRYIL